MHKGFPFLSQYYNQHRFKFYNQKNPNKFEETDTHSISKIILTGSI